MRIPVALLLVASVASCAGPAPEDYVNGSAGRAGEGVGIGKDAHGEACTQQARAGGADIYCGTFTQPSGSVARGGAAGAGDLAALAANSQWRGQIDGRFACSEPVPSTILGGERALVLSCTRRVGGWPQVAMVASVGGTAYYVDGILPALPVLQRSVGVLSGRISADAAPSAPPGQADALFASRLASQSFGAGDVGQYEALMVSGTKANLAESFVPAEQAFRAALALQVKALGERDPNTALPLMHVALQLSDQGRIAEADATFARAGQLAPRAADPTARARLLHYRALHEVNQRRSAEALPLLARAEAAYAALLPSDMLRATVRAKVINASLREAEAPPAGAGLALEPSQQAALIGVIEVRRYRAIALRDLGRFDEAEQSIQSADSLAVAHGLTQRNLTARLSRTAATVADARDAAGGGGAAGLTGMTRASADFGQSQPGTRPYAATELLRAAEYRRDGRDGDALDLCRRAARLLRELKSSTTADLMAPCLDAYAAAAARDSGSAPSILAEMFEASQLVQGGITAQQIALASARLSVGAKDSRVGQAIRRQQDAGIAVSELERQLDARSATGSRELSTGPRRSEAEAERAVAEARTNLAQADAALQQAAPQYGQLIAQVAPAADVLAALAPGEAFASMALSSRGGWIFVLRDGQVAAAPAGAGLPEIDRLVERVRKSVEPSASGVPRFDTEASAALYAATLGRAQSHLGGVDSLVVAPGGKLLSIPLSVLLTGPADPDNLAGAPWLIRRLAITHVPAPANFVSLRRLAGVRPGRAWFGFGDFKPVTLTQAERSFPRGACEDSARLFAGLPPLPFARKELDATRTLLGGSPGDELEGVDFTAERVRHANLKGVQVLHFATHALLPTDLRCQSEPAIVTSAAPGSPDASSALLTTASVMGLDLDADVVVLSACNSGGPGGTDGGESLSGLARAFFYAGARSMMVTHWSVNDQTAALLVADTMRRVRERSAGGVAGALRAAELNLIDNAGKTLPANVAHPFFWAPFALIGEGRGRTVTAGL